MNFLYITRHFPPPVTDGMTRYADCLARGLKATGHGVIVLSGNPEEARVQRKMMTCDGIPVYKSKAAESLKHRPQSWYGFSQRIESLSRKHHIDRIIIQHPYHGAPAMRVRDRLGVPVVYISHTIAGLDRIFRCADRSFHYDAANEQRESASMKRADAVICLAESQRRQLAEIYSVPLERMHVVPTGVPLETVELLPRTLSRLRRVKSGRKKLVLFLGRESWEKGTDLLAEIILKVASMSPRAAFVLVGIERRRWFEYLQLPQTHVFAWMDRAELNALYQLCDIIAVPSRRDSMPYALLEGMANGLVPVGSDVDGIKDVLREGNVGLTCPVQRSPGRVVVDTDCFSTKILSVLENDRLQQTLGENAKRLIEQKYCHEGQIHRFLAAVRHLS